MPRHPGLQADNRVAELLPYYRHAINEVRSKRYDVARAKTALLKEETELENAEKQLAKVESLLHRMSDPLAIGVFPWGLPKSITIAEFRAVVANDGILDTDKDPPLKDDECHADGVSCYWEGCPHPKNQPIKSCPFVVAK